MGTFNYKQWIVDHKYGKLNEQKIFGVRKGYKKGKKLDAGQTAFFNYLADMNNRETIVFKGELDLDYRTFQKQVDDNDASKFVFRNKEGVVVEPETLAQFQAEGNETGIGRQMNVKFKSSDVQEPSGGEKSMTGDAEKIKNHPLLSRVNTKQEWEETMKTVLDLSTNIPQVTRGAIAAFLRDALKNIKDLK